MLATLGSAISFAFAYILMSPGLLALSIYLLSAKPYRKERLIGFFLGSLIVGIFFTVLGFSLGQNALTQMEHGNLSSGINVLIGFLFFFLAIKSLTVKGKRLKKRKVVHGKGMLRWFWIGIVANISNFDVVLVNLTVAKEIGSSHQDLLIKILCLGLNIIFYSLPVSIPIIMSILFPSIAKRVLSAANVFLIHYGRYLICAIFVILGIVFLKRGFASFH